MMSCEGYIDCELVSSLINEINSCEDRKKVGNIDLNVGFDSMTDTQVKKRQSNDNITSCLGNLPMEASSTKVSSRGRKIRNRTNFFGITAEYNLRQSSVVNRIKSELSRKAPRQPKPKSKPPPLSKYRRRAANARERSRMQEINEAFENLRSLIPESDTVSTINESISQRQSSLEDTSSSSRKTKIMTLRQAMDYISALRELLRNSGEGTPDSGGGASDGGEYPDMSSACSILGNISPTFSGDDGDIIVSDSCSDELGLLDSEGETWRN